MGRLAKYPHIPALSTLDPILSAFALLVSSHPLGIPLCIPTYLHTYIHTYIQATYMPLGASWGPLGVGRDPQRAKATNATVLFESH